MVHHVLVKNPRFSNYLQFYFCQQQRAPRTANSFKKQSCFECHSRNRKHLRKDICRWKKLFYVFGLMIRWQFSAFNDFDTSKTIISRRKRIEVKLNQSTKWKGKSFLVVLECISCGVTFAVQHFAHIHCFTLGVCFNNHDYKV